jgi:histidyl-tRNA synthetase
MSEKPSSNPSRRSFQAPKGTRDFYPQDMLRRRYITDAWRRVSLRHGFEEIDGPTFEHLDLYTVKSGEGIVSELFSFQRAGGDDTYALRPEFTPTLARMYAARAKQLPQPTKWFCIPNFFRAERPQRGRLREFFQWNCDVIGGEDRTDADCEILACCVSAMESLGLTSQSVRVAINDRHLLEMALFMTGVDLEGLQSGLALLDKRGKLPVEVWNQQALQIGLNLPLVVEILDFVEPWFHSESGASASTSAEPHWPTNLVAGSEDLRRLWQRSHFHGTSCFQDFKSDLARGLAYYTGMVFEVIAEGERAVAGGGRYDNLIELFGGPPTPACGFGMGDVVLGNLLEDKGLIPEGRDLLEALSRPMPIRPDAFVISSGKDGTDEQVTPFVARLRRGVETQRYTDSQASDDAAKRMKPWDAARYEVPPLHARRSYKATKNVGKLLGEANNAHARYAVIIESAETCSLKNLESGTQTPDIPLAEVGARISRA